MPQANQNPSPKTPAPDTSEAGKGSDLGQAEVQKTVDAEEDKGYRGYTEDDGDYSVSGSVAGDNNPDAGKGEAK